MENFKKWLMVLMASFMLVGVASGCSSNDEKTDTSTEQNGSTGSQDSKSTNSQDDSSSGSQDTSSDQSPAPSGK